MYATAPAAGSWIKQSMLLITTPRQCPWLVVTGKRIAGPVTHPLYFQRQKPDASTVIPICMKIQRGLIAPDVIPRNHGSLRTLQRCTGKAGFHLSGPMLRQNAHNVTSLLPCFVSNPRESNVLIVTRPIIMPPQNRTMCNQACLPIVWNAIP